MAIKLKEKLLKCLFAKILIKPIFSNSCPEYYLLFTPKFSIAKLLHEEVATGLPYPLHPQCSWNHKSLQHP